MPGQWNGTATDDEGLTESSQGTAWETSLGASSFSYDQTTTTTSVENNSGDTTYSVTEGSYTYQTVSPFAMGDSFSETLVFVITGPPQEVATVESVVSGSLTGGDPSPVNFTELENAGHGYSMGAVVAVQVASEGPKGSRSEGVSQGPKGSGPKGSEPKGSSEGVRS